MFNSKPLAVAVAAHISLMAAGAGAAVLEETVVTAQKREQSIQDVGIAITAFTGDQLDQLGFTNAQQVTAMAPGCADDPAQRRGQLFCRDSRGCCQLTSPPTWKAR